MRLGLRAQIGLILLAIMVITVILVDMASVRLMKRSMQDQLARTDERLLRMTADLVETALSGTGPLDGPRAQQALAVACIGMVDAGLMEIIALRSTDGALLARCSTGNAPDRPASATSGDGELQPGAEDRAAASPVSNSSTPALQWVVEPGHEMALILSVPFRVDGVEVGTMTAQFDHAAVAGRLRTTQVLAVAYVTLDALLLLIVGYVLLTLIIVTPIRRIALATRRVAAGDYASHLEIGSNNEIGALAESFNYMVDRLDRNHRDLKKQVAALLSAQNDLERAQAAVIRSEKLASVGHLAAGIAHEVGNPLSALLGFVEILREDPKMHLEDRKEILARLEAELLRIHHIIRGLLDYARSHEDELAEADVGAVIEQAKRLVSVQPQFRGIDIRSEPAGDLPRARVNPDRLLQVFINLLLNSADAIGEKGWVTIDTRTEDQGIQIQVVDSGPGIPEDLLGQIFEPFVTTKPPGRGTGLGLAMCERILAGCGGRIEVDGRTENTGACFTLWVPRAEDPEEISMRAPERRRGE